MSVSHTQGKKKLCAANDNSFGKSCIIINLPENTPISIVEVEVFDRLISNLKELTANDDIEPSQID